MLIKITFSEVESRKLITRFVRFNPVAAERGVYIQPGYRVGAVYIYTRVYIYKLSQSCNRSAVKNDGAITVDKSHFSTF